MSDYSLTIGTQLSDVFNTHSYVQLAQDDKRRTYFYAPLAGKKYMAHYRTGTIIRTHKIPVLDWHISRPLCATQYKTLRQTLDAAMFKDLGHYSLLFHNCAHFAAQTGIEHGISFHQRTIMTPDILAQQIAQLTQGALPAQTASQPFGMAKRTIQRRHRLG